MTLSLKEIRSRITFRTFNVQVGSWEFYIEAVDSQDALLDLMEGDFDPPYGLLLWESAIALAQTLMPLGSEMQGKTVLELGCGTGLPGILCARSGANVVQSDMFSYCTDLAQHNAEVNQISNIGYHLSNWRDWNAPGVFDYVIGADLFYDRMVHRDLVNVLARSLKPDGRIYFADPQRLSTPAFLEMARLAGWQSSTTAVPTSIIHDSPSVKAFREIDVHRLIRAPR